MKKHRKVQIRGTPHLLSDGSVLAMLRVHMGQDYAQNKPSSILTHHTKTSIDEDTSLVITQVACVNLIPISGDGLKLFVISICLYTSSFISNTY